MGRLDRSGDHLREALAIFRRNGNRTGEGSVLDGLGMLHTRRGRLGEAVAFHRQAVEIARETGDRWGEAWALNGLGEASPAAEALTWHQAAIEVATASGDRGQEARGHAGLGRAHLTLGDRASAQTHLRYALQVYTDLESPEAAAVRDLLDS